MTHAISIKGLSKTFRTGLRRKKTDALRGLDLQVAQGEIFGFLGPNGAGKTTAIKILVGLLRPDNGDAQLFGRSVSDRKSRFRLGYLPELPDFYDYLTPQEFLALCGRLSKPSWSDLSLKTEQVLERVGLDPKENRQLRKFSKGMLQRVGLAQTLLSDPDLLILDEPLGGLDPLGRRFFKDLILELRSAGKTVFFSSHILSEVESLCDRFAFLHKGKLVAQGTLPSLLCQTEAPWEILVEGEIARMDDTLCEKTKSAIPAGGNTLLTIKADQEINTVLSLLLKRGYKVRQVTQRQPSLEEVFIRTLSLSGTTDNETITRD